ncbi:MAG TPA: acyl carrier protein [Gemmatimonadales bacterium]|jgi:acyl carrier protein|nr:acyl carrier protein [Gemmatimonadales bacterium]
MTEDAETKLQDIVRAALELPPDADVTRARQPGIASWDSLAHVSLMLGIESEFGVSIAVADQLHLTSYPAIRSYLEEHGVGRAVR